MATSSVTALIRGLKEGDTDAANDLIERYLDALKIRADQRLEDRPLARKTSDADDVVMSAFESLWRGAQAGRFTDLSNRGELWCLLLTLAYRKIEDHRRHESRQKRGGRLIVDEDVGEWSSLQGTDPTPEEVAVVDDQIRSFLQGLPRDDYRKIVLMRLEGFSIKEIAEELSVTTRAIDRKLQNIKDSLSRRLKQDNTDGSTQTTTTTVL